jgi:hypothetical protein
MNTFEFIVALAREANAPFAFAIVALAAGIAVPIVVSMMGRYSQQTTQLQAKRDVEIKKLETTVRNGSVALTKKPSADY